MVNNKKATLSICYRITETDLILGLSQITNSTGEQIWELSPNATGSNDHYSIYPIKDTPVIAPLSPSNVRNIQYAHIPELTELNWVPYDVIHVEAAADVFYDKGDFDDFTDRIISLLSTAPEPEEEQFNHTTILNDLSQLHQLKKKDLQALDDPELLKYFIRLLKRNGCDEDTGVVQRAIDWIENGKPAIK